MTAPTLPLAFGSAIHNAGYSAHFLNRLIRKVSDPDKLRELFPSNGGESHLLNDYCTGLIRTWNELRTGTDLSEVWSLKVYCILPAAVSDGGPVALEAGTDRLWIGYAAPYEDSNNVSTIIHQTDPANYSTDSIGSLPIRELFKTMDYSVPVVEFTITERGAPCCLVETGPDRLRVQVPNPTGTKASDKPSTVGRRSGDNLGKKVEYARHHAAIRNFIPHQLVRDPLVDLDKQRKAILAKVVELVKNEENRLLRTSFAVVNALHGEPGCNTLGFVTTALLWPAQDAPCVIGMLYSPKSLCENAVAFFSTMLPNLLPACLHAADHFDAVSVKSWSWDAGRIEQQLQGLALQLWRVMWTDWEAEIMSGNRTRISHEKLFPYARLYQALEIHAPDEHKATPELSRAKTAIETAISTASKLKPLGYRFEVIVAPRARVAKGYCFRVSRLT